MKKIVVCALAVVVTLFAIASSTRAGSLPPAVGGTLPDITLPAPSNSTDKNYPGVSGFRSFKIPQIRAKVVVIEIFNMYCPYCQREAPNVNELYAKIDQNPALKDAVKIIGIGAGKETSIGRSCRGAGKSEINTGGRLRHNPAYFPAARPYTPFYGLDDNKHAFPRPSLL